MTEPPRITIVLVPGGMDMAAALMAHLLGPEVADRAAARIELEVHGNPTRDPFAEPLGIS